MTLQEQVFTDIYLKFTQIFTRTQVEEEEETPIPEKVIRCVWNDQLFHTDNLKTTGGQKLEVVFPGYWNFGSGPDFKSAAIRVDGELLEGDVELHVYGADWKSHGHSTNNDYDNVILHVFMWQGRGKRKIQPADAAPPKPLSRPHIHELELKDYLKASILELQEGLDFDNYPLLNQFNYGLCHRPLARLSREKFSELLKNAGDARIQTKMERFHDRIITRGYEQTFYEGVAEAMGYPSNKRQFRDLAEIVPLAEIKQRVPAKSSYEDKIHLIQALLFGVSGLIDFDDLPKNASPKDRAYFNRLGTLWARHRRRFQDRLMDRKEWRFGRMRPANFPYRRVAGLSHLLARHWENGLFADFLECLKSTVPISLEKGYTGPTRKKVVDFFRVESEDYWAWHYTPGGKKLQRKQQVVGPDRSREITINIVLPIGLIYARASKSAPLEQALGLLFQSKIRPADNKWIRFMKHYILGDKEKLLKELDSDQKTQGMMQVYQDYCTRNQNNCLRCQFPSVVERYFA
ncbi:MAG: DUF2851 family protein [Nitrospinaceae bacterium]|nr:DUF2851 family protein [Nitrospinaceae bacterium]NIR56966.1 DUF2851 family protein [Nitrospinaceae bacterium]NIS87423.1 DUF2851 family protein [Nitrospinaceae bacterium]NIT84275.1 DUF2851 family protein [Nitrospinaceae bacterium]NIU46462.1 DUF2851 family protein [Nitrospinaceae bacterium]